MQRARSRLGRVTTRRADATPGDAGMAMIGVVLFGAALVIMSVTAVSRGNAQFGTTDLDRNWEHSLAAAESGLSWGMAALEGDLAWHTGDAIPEEILGTSDERAWAVAAADDKDAGAVIAAPSGEFVVIKPANAAVVFGVGYTPSRDADDRRVRVVRAGYELVPTEFDWITNLAVITQGNLEVIGNPSFYTGPAVGIHTNGNLQSSGSTYLDGCMSASGTAQMGGAVTQGEHCPSPGGQPPMPVPELDPRERWHTSTHDLCPSGRVRAGPAHPTLGHTVGESPCTGQVLENDANANPYNGWRFAHPNFTEEWTFVSTAAFDGVFYVRHGSVRVESSPGSSATPWLATIITEASGACPEAQRGDIYIAGSPTFDPYPGSGNIALLAGRDLQIAGNPKMSGVVGAVEQIEITGTATVTGGTYVAGTTCDTPGSPVSINYVGGNASVVNDTAVETDLSIWIDLLTLTQWAEARS